MVSATSKMFQQSILLNSGAHRKPFSLGFSLLLQAAAVGVLSLVPLLYSPGIPAVHLRSLLLVHSPTPTPVETRQPLPEGRTPSIHRFLFNPATVSHPLALQHAAAVSVVSASTPDLGTADSEHNVTGDAILSSINALPQPAPVSLERPPVKAAAKAIRVGNGVAEANLLLKVQPSYPPLARSARVSGTVEFSATISKEGTIENLQLVRGHPLLVAAARQAILQWRYRPTLLNGQPVEVLTSIVVTFTLNQ